MATLIDGYNLMHAAGMLGRNPGPGSLQRARAALLRFLAAALPEPERNATTVVFDAPAASPGLPGDEEFQGIRVRYAVGYDSADSLMAELIRKDPAPRRWSSCRAIERYSAAPDGGAPPRSTANGGLSSSAASGRTRLIRNLMPTINRPPP
jgi:uncharacterized protein